MEIEGTLSASVWPVYIGAAMQGPTPPFTSSEPHNGGYERGTILWYPVPDERQIVGRARIRVPAGLYTHFLYFHHPTRPQTCGVTQMEHPLRFWQTTVIDVDPIVNHDQQLAKQLGE